MKRILTILFSLSIASCISLAAYSPEVTGSPKGSTLIERDNYTVSYNHKAKCPDWVEWTLDAARLEKNVSRDDCSFTPDPELQGAQAQPSDYTRNRLGLDRGHMCPAADNTASEEWMTSSFYMTNICPQDHVLNEGIWCELEKRCRVYARMYGNVRIVCGPMFGNNPLTIGNNGVHVPFAFFKVIMTERKGQRHGLAFIFPNEAIYPQRSIFLYAYSIDQAEKMTGFDFYSDLTEAQQEEFESSTDISFWDIPWKK